MSDPDDDSRHWCASLSLAIVSDIGEAPATSRNFPSGLCENASDACTRCAVLPGCCSLQGLTLALSLDLQSQCEIQTSEAL